MSFGIRLPAATFVSCLLLFSVEFNHIYAGGRLTDQITAEIVGANPEEIIVGVCIAVAFPRKYKEIEALVRFDERVHHSQSARHMNIVVNVACRQHETTFQV